MARLKFPRLALGFLARDAISLLQPARKLVAVSLELGQVIVRELASKGQTQSRSGSPAASRGYDLDRHGVGLWIEEDARLPVLELRAHLRDLLLQGILARTVIGAFAQHEGLDHPVQGLRGELPMGDDDGGLLGGALQLRRVRARRRRISM
ncbi:MAG: hypothetical protein WBW93_20765 [Steroidobacteraceae bacterium]